MTVEPGTRLLHCRVVDEIGEGGMGVVWRAVDTADDREVAIKILPEAIAGIEIGTGAVLFELDVTSARETGRDAGALLRCATLRPRPRHHGRSTT